MNTLEEQRLKRWSLHQTAEIRSDLKRYFGELNRKPGHSKLETLHEIRTNLSMLRDFVEDEITRLQGGKTE